MLRITNYAIRKCFSSFVSIKEQSPETVLGPEVAESLSEYSKAMEFILEKNWKMAELELKKAAEILSKSGQKGEPSHNFILQRLAQTQRTQSKLSDCEQSLEEIVKNYRATYPKYLTQLELSYQTLYKQYLSSNLSKALKLGEILHRETHWSVLKKETQKNIKFMYATALVLQGKDFNKAKRVFNDLIRMNPEGNTCFVLHNLAVAQWMHVQKFYGMELKSMSASQEEEFKKATTEFTEAVPNLQKAVQLFEGFPDIFTLESDLNFKNKLTGLSLSNISEIFMEKIEPEVKSRQTAHKWLQLSLKFYEDLDKPQIGRTLILMGTLMKAKGDLKYSELMYKSAIEVLRDKNTFNEVLALNAYAAMLKLKGSNQEDLEKYNERANKIAISLPHWHERMVYLHVPEWTL